MRVRTAFSFVAVVFAMAAAALPRPSVAATFSCDEAGIRAAIANGGGPHGFSCAAGAIVTTFEEIVIDNDVILDGEDRLTIDGNDSHRVLSVAPGVSAELRGLTISGGFLSRSDVEDVFNRGAGVRNFGTLVVMGCRFVGNSALDGGGAMSNAHRLTIEHSEVSGSTGPAVFDEGTEELSILGSQIVDNDSSGVANARRRVDAVAGALTIRDSVISRNSRGVGVGFGQVSIVNSDVSDNSETGISWNGVGSIAGTTVTRNLLGVSNFGTLEISDSSISDNGSSSDRPDRFNISVGAIQNFGILTLTDSDVSRNANFELVAGINSEGELTVIRSRITDNHVAEASLGSPFVAGGLLAEGARTLVRDSLISGNSVVGRGIAAGGGIANFSPSMSIINTTISGNSATGMVVIGAAISNRLAGNRTPVLELEHVTIADNVSVGALFSSVLANGGEMRVVNSILQDCSDALLISRGGNIESAGDTCGLDHASDQVSVAPEALGLDFLQDAGGPTDTHPLLADSVAIDSAQLGSCPETDQRGFLRPVGEGCDVGAFEFGAVAPPSCDEARADVALLWPPNRMFQEVSVEGVTTGSGADADITIVSVFQDEPVRAAWAKSKRAKRRGFGDPCPDAKLTDGNLALLRAQRDPQSNGRVYRVAFLASDDAGATCAGEVSVCAPQDQRGGGSCVDDGPLFDSTQCEDLEASLGAEAGCGLGYELVALLPAWFALRRRGRLPRTREV